MVWIEYKKNHLDNSTVQNTIALNHPNYKRHLGASMANVSSSTSATGGHFTGGENPHEPEYVIKLGSLAISNECLTPTSAQNFSTKVKRQTMWRQRVWPSLGSSGSEIKASSGTEMVTISARKQTHNRSTAFQHLNLRWEVRVYATPRPGDTYP